MSFALFQCICLLSSLPLVIRAQNNKNITLGSILTAGDASNPSWLSPSGDFAFGFRQVAPTGGFLLAIWYNKIPEKTVTWSANRNELAQRGSKLKLTANGLLLSDPNNKLMWTASSATGSGVAYVVMLNSGNLMLADQNGGALWQSFDEPTDTILPTQIMTSSSELIARLSETNYSEGRFQLQIQTNGDLQAYTINWPQKSLPYFTYFSTSTTGKGYQVVFNQSGMIYVAAQNGTVVAPVLSEQMDPAQDLYQRAILEFDGVFRRYVYPRSNSTNRPINWTMAMDFVPQDICRLITTPEGPGVCGYNSYCEMDQETIRPKCGCPPGYSFFDGMDRLKGCKPNFIAQSCLEDPKENDQFELIEMNPASFHGFNSDHYLGISESACRESCLSDCLCAAAYYVDSQSACWKKRFPLSDGWVGPDAGGRIFIKVGNVNSTTNPDAAQSNPTIQGGGDKHQATILIESVFLGSSVFLNIILLTLAVLMATFCRKSRENTPVHQDIAGTNMRSFGYKELHEATNGFKEVIGQGAYATVYKGLLDREEGNVIAVKKLNELVKENQKEFEGEVKAIAQTGHRNLVRLIGFCNDGQHRLLAYDYMPNGSLADVLFKDQKPSWTQRIKFSFEIARGLNYLHEECSIQIIHCDIKPQNVLLDDSFTARISDFGLAKLLKKDQSHTMTGIRGTKGYVAPEWFKSMPITAKVDVYSFGILLLEIICCRRCFVADMEDENQMVLADWAYDCYKEGRIDKLVESDYEALHDIEKVQKLVLIALCCIQDDPSHRPSMNNVVEMIKGALELSQHHDLAPYIISMNDGHGNSRSFTVGDARN